MTAALRVLCYGIAADALDEQVQISETSIMNSMKEFCKTIISLYGNHYLRGPN